MLYGKRTIRMGWVSIPSLVRALYSQNCKFSHMSCFLIKISIKDNKNRKLSNRIYHQADRFRPSSAAQRREPPSDHPSCRHSPPWSSRSPPPSPNWAAGGARSTRKATAGGHVTRTLPWPAAPSSRTPSPSSPARKAPAWSPHRRRLRHRRRRRRRREGRICGESNRSIRRGVWSCRRRRSRSSTGSPWRARSSHRRCEPLLLEKGIEGEMRRARGGQRRGFGNEGRWPEEERVPIIELEGFVTRIRFCAGIFRLSLRWLSDGEVSGVGFLLVFFTLFANGTIFSYLLILCTNLFQFLKSKLTIRKALYLRRWGLICYL